MPAMRIPSVLESGLDRLLPPHPVVCLMCMHEQRSALSRPRLPPSGPPPTHSPLLLLPPLQATAKADSSLQANVSVPLFCFKQTQANQYNQCGDFSSYAFQGGCLPGCEPELMRSHCLYPPATSRGPPVPSAPPQAFITPPSCVPEAPDPPAPPPRPLTPTPTPPGAMLGDPASACPAVAASGRRLALRKLLQNQASSWMDMVVCSVLVLVLVYWPPGQLRSATRHGLACHGSPGSTGYSTGGWPLRWPTLRWPSPSPSHHGST